MHSIESFYSLLFYHNVAADSSLQSYL